ncbi:MAG: distal tail protein Dit [Lachnospirales bacterium]
MTGFTFNGYHSYRDFDLLVRYDNRGVLPSRKVVSYDLAQGNYGNYYYDTNSFDNRIITLSLYLVCNNMEELRDKIRNISAWLSSSSSNIIFDDEPDKQYIGFVKDQIEFKEGFNYGICEVEFVCQPLILSLDVCENNEKINKNNKKISLETIGSMGTKPIITIFNKGDDITALRLTLENREDC